MKSTALEFLKIKVKRSETGYVYVFRLTKDERKVIEDLKKRHPRITTSKL